jgi:YfiH family protein
MELLDWDAPGPYRVAFSTRDGGVSEGAFRSLNLGALTDDEPAAVAENRRRLCDAVGTDPHRATMAWQQHGAAVTRAKPTGVVELGTEFERCDGLWSDDPGQGMALVTADCLPVALCRTGGAPALCLLHVGWRGLLDGIVETGCRSLGSSGLAAAIGPGIGPCCYEVGDDVARPFRAAFGNDIARDGTLDLWTAAARALEAAGCDTVERTDRCTACEPSAFFSHRRDAGRTGRQGVIGHVVER